MNQTFPSRSGSRVKKNSDSVHLCFATAGDTPSREKWGAERIQDMDSDPDLRFKNRIRQIRIQYVLVYMPRK